MLILASIIRPHARKRSGLTKARTRGCPSFLALALLVSLSGMPAKECAAEAADAIERVKPSVVAVGTYEGSRSPAFAFLGTGFVIGDGSLVATSAHVLPPVLDTERRGALVVAVSDASQHTRIQARPAKLLVLDSAHDLAVLRIQGPKLPALRLAESDKVREGESYLFTGFPIGTVLGLIPATHRAMVSARTPIAIPTASARQLDPRAIRRLAHTPYSVFQLDATAYPGNSGSPLYDPESGAVIVLINMVFVKGAKEAALSQPSGITYAIPSEPLQQLLQSTK